MRLAEDVFLRITSLENLFAAWDEFKSGKLSKVDVQRFEWQLEPELFKLHRELRSGRYRHGPYYSFALRDPKPRAIHKATVRDRIVHHAVFAVLNPLFEPSFYWGSFSCRVGKGTHRGVLALEGILRRVSRNYTRPCFVLKCDIKKFFASINHQILRSLLDKKVKDDRTRRLLQLLIDSFTTHTHTHTHTHQRVRPTGLPIGNLTSQLFANVYLNELDHFIKEQLHVKHYLRYTDDFVVISDSESYLQGLIMPIQQFLVERLHLQLHPHKVTIRKFSQGIDFLGYVLLPHYRRVRTRTKQRIFKKLAYQQSRYRQGKISRETLDQSVQSYLGVLSHANSHKLSEKLKNAAWLD